MEKQFKLYGRVEREYRCPYCREWITITASAHGPCRNAINRDPMPENAQQRDAIILRITPTYSIRVKDRRAIRYILKEVSK